MNLKSLFNYQRFESNDHLNRLINDTVNRYSGVTLSESELMMVAAAGEEKPKEDKEKLDKK